MRRFPVSPETVTVLGYRPRTTKDARWAGLNLARAEPRQQSNLMLAAVGEDAAPLDIHLNVPWQHPDDRAAGLGDDGCRYRVRPRMEVGKKWQGQKVQSVAFERWDGKWFIAVEFAPRPDTDPLRAPSVAVQPIKEGP